jgi:hypothetical protein
MQNPHSIINAEEEINRVVELLERKTEQVNFLRRKRHYILILWLSLNVLTLALFPNRVTSILVKQLVLVLLVILLRALVIIHMRRSSPRSYLAWYLVLGLATSKLSDVGTVRTLIEKHRYELEQYAGSYARLQDHWRRSMLDSLSLLSI